jgi:hypothetical protein
VVWFFKRIENYIIAPTGNGFRVVETLPDGRNSSVDGFSTESDARQWLDSFVILIGLADCLAGNTVRH